MKTKNDGLKLFIVKKYVMAKSANDAIRLEASQAPDDVFMDEGWRQQALTQSFNVGFNTPKPKTND